MSELTDDEFILNITSGGYYSIKEILIRLEKASADNKTLDNKARSYWKRLTSEEEYGHKLKANNKILIETLEYISTVLEPMRTSAFRGHGNIKAAYNQAQKTLKQVSEK